jgi:hypothetical protein
MFPGKKQKKEGHVPTAFEETIGFLLVPWSSKFPNLDAIGKDGRNGRKATQIGQHL